MKLHRLTLRLQSPLGTPLAGPTLFGQLCWIRHDGWGAAALSDWLSDPARMWRVSDGFPHDFLPKPLCSAPARPESGQTPRRSEDFKARKKLVFVRRDQWLAHRESWDEAEIPLAAMRKDPALPRRLAHNVVDRHGRGTLDEGGLFFTDEDWRFASPGRAEDALVDIYVEADAPQDEIAGMFAALGESGFGRDASTGRGRWKVETIAADEALADGGPATTPSARRMTLTRGILTPETMRDALWRVQPHFGRTGPQLALAGTSPFKRPVLLIEPGATFTPANDGPFGRWITGVHPERPEIGLNGLHIPIPFRPAGQAGEAAA